MMTNEHAGVASHTTPAAEADEEFTDHRKRLLFAAGCLLGFGFLGWMAYNMPVGRATDPGPGFFPLIVSAVGLGSSFLVLLESSIRLRRTGQERGPEGTSPAVLLFAGLLVLFAVLIPLIGFYISAAAFSVASVRIIGGCSWLKSTVVGALIGAVTSVLAIEVLNIRLQSWPGL